MRCPVCLDCELDPIVHHGIEIDRCTRCRGTWLDRGELDKLLDLAEARSPVPARRPGGEADRTSRRPDRDDERMRDRRDDDRRDDDRRKPSKKRKRKGAFAELLEDVFDALD